MARGYLALLGSGETAPGMTRVHRELLARYERPRAVNLDTTYGFQENVPQMSAKLQEYFQVALTQTLETLSLPSFADASELTRARVRQQVREANYIFAGPGSPSYAVNQWRPLGLADDLRQALANDATICFASAAALTLGTYTAPIYEIYKAGSPLYWLDGLDVFAIAGLRCSVIAHFDNREGANYDTSCCYLGERRLALLEQELDGVATLGVDEHTVLLFDFAADTVRVTGRGVGHWRVDGVDHVLENESVTPLDALRNAEPLEIAPVVSAPATDADSLDELGELAARGGASGLDALARLMERARTGGAGFIDPAPLVEAVLAARVHAREAKQYQLADELRDALVQSGVVVSDGPTGTTWSIG